MYSVELRLMNKEFEDVALIDTYVSLSWTDKYNEYGEFEIVLPLTQENVDLYKKDYYVWKNDTEHVMIIETIEIDESNKDSNTRLKISGKSLESILNRRIIWSKKEFSESSKLQDDIKTLLNDAIISPTSTDRKISNFIFEETTDATITAMTHEGEYEGDNLYDIISDICGDKHLGFKIILNNSNQFVFSLYMGADRSTEQTTNNPVIFSDEYDNLFNSEYVESTSDYKNVCLYRGSSSDGTSGTATGLDRREMYKSNSSSTSTSTKSLSQRAAEALERYAITSAVDGDIEVNNDVQMFTYREDYFVGDWITFRNRWGKETKARISEMLLSGDTSGITLSPTFTTKKEEEDEDAENQEEEDNKSDSSSSSSSSSSTTTDSDDD